MNRYTRLSTALLIAASLTACGGDAPEDEAAAQSTEGTTPAETAPAPAATSTPAEQRKTLTVEDIDRWQRGMEAEKKAVQDAAARIAEAKDENSKVEALFASTEMSTLDAGAAAAGVDRDQYRRIRSTLSSAVSQLSPIEAEMDLSGMPPQMVEEMKRAREAGIERLSSELPADVVEALKPRAAELRQQDKELVGERLKVANAAR